MTGMDKNTGQAISGNAYLRQRIENALTTPLRSTVMLRERGADIKAILDKPLTPSNVVRVYRVFAAALAHPLAGLPDFRVERIRLSDVKDLDAGRPLFDISGTDLSTGGKVVLEGIAA